VPAVHDKRSAPSWLSLAAPLCIALALFAAEPSTAEEYVAVLNAENPSVEFSVQTARLLYGGYKRKWKDNRSVALILPPVGSPAMRFLAQRVFKVSSESQVQRYYLEALFQQRLGEVPPHLDTASAVARVRSDARQMAVAARSELGDTHGCKLFALGTMD
jgi:hypothetical protein